MNVLGLSLILVGLVAAPPSPSRSPSSQSPPAFVFVQTAKPATAVVHVTGPARLPIDAKTADVSVLDDAQVVTVVVDLRRLDSGLGFRDDHMRNKYLEVQRFPNTRLVVDRTTLEARADNVVDGKSAGRITLHGVTRTLPFSYRATCSHGSVCDVAARIDIDMTDFGVVVAPYLGMTVQRRVTIDVSFQVEPRARDRRM